METFPLASIRFAQDAVQGPAADKIWAGTGAASEAWAPPLRGQLTDSAGAVTFAQAYAPYGTVATTSGNGATSYGFTNEYQNSYIKLIYLRSRMYSSITGRFLTRDTWGGDAMKPVSYNIWQYAYLNPINSLGVGLPLLG